MKPVSRWAIAVAIVLIPSAVMATAVISESIEAMAFNSAVIVRGKVLQAQPQLDERHGRIYTYAELRVTEVIKGNAKVTSVLVKSPGGDLGGRGQRVAGAEHYKVGEDTILFLEAAVDEPGVFICRALAAGKFDVEKSRTGELHAVRHLDGIGFFEPTNTRVHAVQPDADLGTVDAFLARVRKAVKDGAR